MDEVVNYVGAINYGLERLSSLPLSKRLIREIHAELLRGGRGAHRMPGEFRRNQNWIGPDGAPIDRATFVSSPVPDMRRALDDFERFLHDERELPILIHVGLAHAQFETIHPGALAGPRSGLANADKLTLTDTEQHPARGRDRSDITEQRRLPRERREIRNTAASISGHHRQITSPVPDRGPIDALACAPARRSGRSSAHSLSRDRQQRRPRTRRQTDAVRPPIHLANR